MKQTKAECRVLVRAVLLFVLPLLSSPFYQNLYRLSVISVVRMKLLNAYEFTRKSLFHCCSMRIVLQSSHISPDLLCISFSLRDLTNEIESYAVRNVSHWFLCCERSYEMLHDCTTWRSDSYASCARTPHVTYVKDLKFL